MEKKDFQNIKRTQKDYSMSFKLSVVSEIECGEIFRFVISIRHIVGG